MARAQKYTIPFAAIDGRQYAVNVYVEGYTGSVQTLTGASDPFYTSELNDHEWLTVPVRTQSGYIRIVCDEDEWRGMVPTSATSHYVELVQGSDVKWMGYIKPEAFTHALYSGTDEYEFPVQCPLSVLDGMQLAWDADEVQNTFARLLSRVLSLSGVTFSKCWFTNNIAQDNPTLSGPTSDLAARVSVTRYYEIAIESTTYDTQYYTPSASALEILSDICQFWGWELHMSGKDLYFTAYDEHMGFRGVPFADLATLTYQYAPTFNAEGTAPVEGAIYMTNQHTVELELPAKSVTVKTDIDKREDIIDFDLDTLGQFSARPVWFESTDGKSSAECAPLRTTYDGVLANGTLFSYNGHTAQDPAALQHLTQLGYGMYYHPILRKVDEWNTADSNTKYEYSFTEMLFLSACPEYNVNSGYSILKFETATPYSLSDCAICIHSNVKFRVEASATGSVKTPLSMMVMLGDYYWDNDNQAWLQRPTGTWQGAYFNVPCGSKSSPSQGTTNAEIVPNFTYTTPYQGAEGFILPVEIGISGKLSIYIRVYQYEMSDFETAYQQVVLNAVQYWRLSDFGVSVVRKQPDAPGRAITFEDSHEYTAVHSNDSSKNISVDVNFATDNNNEFGTAFVCIFSGSYMSTLTYANGDTERPEQHLCDRLSALYSKPTEWREIDVSDAQAKYITPRYVLKDANGHYWAPIAAARQWSEGIVRLTLGDMGTWTPPASYNLADCNNWLLLTTDNKQLVVWNGPIPYEVPSPTIAPGSGGITLSQQITISISGSATSAEYSTDGNTWTTYTEPLTLTTNTTIYARATDGDGNVSEIVSAEYEVLPYEAKVEYLESSGTQYINTGFILNIRNFILELEFQSEYTNISDFETFIGFMKSSSSVVPRSGFHKYSEKWMFGTNATMATNVSVDKNNHTIKIMGNATNNRDYLYIDDVYIAEATTNASGIGTNSYPFYLFARNLGNVFNNPSRAKVRKLTITTYEDSDYLTMRNKIDFIPVRIGTTGYMYDRVSKTLFGNAGTGVFVLGNDVN